MYCCHAFSGTDTRQAISPARADHDLVQNYEHLRGSPHQLQARPHVPRQLFARCALGVGLVRNGFEPFGESLDHGPYQRDLGRVVMDQRCIVDPDLPGHISHSEPLETHSKQTVDRRRNYLLLPINARSMHNHGNTLFAR